MRSFRIVGYIDSNDFRLGKDGEPDIFISIPYDDVTNLKSVYDLAYKYFYYGEGFLELQLVLLYLDDGENSLQLYASFESF